MKFTTKDVLVIVWDDAVFDSGWKTEEKYLFDDDDLKHMTIGKFIRGSEKSISVAQSWRLNSTSDEGIGEIMTIPKKVILMHEQIQSETNLNK